MTEQQATEVVILTGPDGEHYAIQKDRLERARITEDERSNLEQAMGDDVSGFASRGYSIYGSLEVQRVEQRPSDRFESFWFDVNSGHIGKTATPIVQVMID